MSHIYFNAGFIALKKSGPLYKACSSFKFESFTLSDETSHDFQVRVFFVVTKQATISNQVISILCVRLKTRFIHDHDKLGIIPDILRN